MARNGNHHVSAAAKEVAEHASALTRLEVELAKLEVKHKVTALGLGAALGAGALVVALFAFVFALAAAAAALTLVLATWLALLVFAGGLLVVAGALGIAAAGRLRRGTPPLPKSAIREAKLTQEAIKG